MHSSPHHRDLYTVEQVRALDRRAIDDLGITGFELMNRAATAAFAALCRHWPEARRIVVFCGPGNNGGDGYLLASLAHGAGMAVEVIELSDAPRGDAALARDTWQRSEGTSRHWQHDAPLPQADVYVDALYGTGLNRAPEASAANLIQRINASAVPVLALDVPSGLNADTGECPGVAVRADLTVSFIAAKRGLYTGQAATKVGGLQIDTLGLPEILWQGMPTDATLLEAMHLPPRARDAHKGDCGHVLAVGGDRGTAGAIRLCGEAALRSGAGLVSIATRNENLIALNSARPELMAHGVHGPQELQPLLDRADVLAVGPGLGQGAWGHALWLTALDSGKPMVLDADGLNLLAREPHRFDGHVVLTPHPGEAARLLGTTIAQVQTDRFAAARALAQRYGAVAVLKGSGSLVAHPDGRLDVCIWGNPGMATGGMGDLLTGVIAALLAQGCSAWDAARMGVGLHARAGDLAAHHGERGLLASDLLEPLRALGNGFAHD
ncbi:NAD(P)H-hydrate dehydratase [Dyella caseinilytica]|uniref:Bifunctional NAD(P)H-hydrate repair enzyme n=1 Tax=Dyella caseinilytica TaxID=1849581 RepID=A0ABX7GWU3_9GAMM|nr:NAD(P)H-hydrate dehydratase [Dyella caseinilytica]QRN54941.1 NAD(P)H-hydrate dehydratase [Dyella caseinilytica]GFZ98119.1 bifunctional NAD(P)H-hydrate repair enzyme [Dyella caseinilytica]